MPPRAISLLSYCVHMMGALLLLVAFLGRSTANDLDSCRGEKCTTMIQTMSISSPAPTPDSTPAPTPDPTPAPTAIWGFLGNKRNGNLCMDIKGHPPASNGDHIQTWSCEFDKGDNDTDQIWTLTSAGFLSNIADSSKCVDVQGVPPDSMTNGRKIQAYDCEKSEANTDQKWMLDGDGFIRNQANSSKCVDVPGISGDQLGLKLQIWDCDDLRDQKWEFRARPAPDPTPAPAPTPDPTPAPTPDPTPPSPYMAAGWNQPPYQNTDWGEWGVEEKCPGYGRIRCARQKVQEFQFGHDNTAVNGLELICESGETLHSTVGPNGNWSEKICCNKAYGQYIAGASIASQHKQGDDDDTGVNGVQLGCHSPGDSWVSNINNAGKISFANNGPSGVFRGINPCWRDEHVCGLKTRVQDHMSDGDNTALNTIAFKCCGSKPTTMSGYVRSIRSSLLCMDIKGHPPASNRDPIQSYFCEFDKGDNDTDQIWTLTSDGFIQNNADPSKCVDVQGVLPDSMTNGRKIQAYDCEFSEANTDQKWFLDGDGFIRNTADSSMCIDLPGQGQASVAKYGPLQLQLWKCEYNGPSTTDHKWYISA